MKSMKIIWMALIACTLIICNAGNARAIELLDGSLTLRGNVQQTANYMEKEDPNRDYRWGSFRSIIRGEGVYKFVDSQDRNLSLHVLGNYYYDEAPDLDPGLKRVIQDEAGRDKIRDFRRPRDMNEYLTEAYLDMQYQSWFQFKLGKQLVSWGQCASAQVADLINPLALQYIVAFPDWEDYKLGLWMGRFFITPPNMWNDIGFEFLVIPQYLAQRYPPAGSSLFYGTGIDPTFQPILDKMKKEEPDEFSLDDLEYGLRIKGNAPIGPGVDWTLSRFHTRADSAIINGKKGYNEILRMILGLGFHEKGGAFRYPWYSSNAATFMVPLDFIKSTFRGEVVYNTNVKYQAGTYDIKKRDMFTSALTLKRNTMVPFISEWNNQRSFTFTLTWYSYKLMNHQKDIHWESYSKRGSKNSIEFMAETGFWFDRILPYFYSSTNLNNGDHIFSGGFIFQPGDHWSWQFTYQHLDSGVSRYQSQAIMSARYEFF